MRKLASIQEITSIEKIDIILNEIIEDNFVNNPLIIDCSSMENMLENINNWNEKKRGMLSHYIVGRIRENKIIPEKWVSEYNTLTRMKYAKEGDIDKFFCDE